MPTDTKKNEYTIAKKRRSDNPKYDHWPEEDYYVVVDGNGNEVGMPATLEEYCVSERNKLNKAYEAGASSVFSKLTDENEIRTLAEEMVPRDYLQCDAEGRGYYEHSEHQQLRRDALVDILKKFGVPFIGNSIE